MSKYEKQIASIIDGEVFTDEKTLTEKSLDTSLFQVMPELVVAPKNSTDIQKLVNFVSKEKEMGGQLSLTARSAGTDMTGGPLTNSIVVDFTKHFDKILAVSDHEATTEPGVYYRDFEKETLKHNAFMPSFPASRELCTVGGMVANNSGGEKTLRYGKTAKYVKQIKAVLSNGNEYVIRPLSLTELTAKEEQTNFEGSFYRQIHALIKDNYETIKGAKPDVSKNSSGYALWDVLDKENSIFDLTKLFVGSQGTLGLITEVTFTLVKPQTHSRLLIIFLPEMSRLGELVNAVLKFGPESFESYDDHTFKIALRLFPRIVNRLGGNIFMLGIRFIPEFLAVLTGGVPKLVLMAEFTADNEEAAAAKAVAAQKAIKSFKLQTRITTSKADADKYWTVRRESFALLREKVKDVRTAPFIDDLVVRPDVLPEFLPKLYELLDQYPLTYTVAGHMGDANFHIIPLMDMKDPESKKIIHELTEKVYQLVWQFKGSNTGEHNDGLMRTPYLPEMYGPEVYQLFVKLKNIFDPQNIFNPGKKINGDLHFSEEHIVTK